MVAPTINEKLQVAASQLKPLHESDHTEETPFWDIQDVMEALRIANRHGVPLNKLYAHVSGAQLAV